VVVYRDGASCCPGVHVHLAMVFCGSRMGGVVVCLAGVRACAAVCDGDGRGASLEPWFLLETGGGR